jgi:hypothetical protein
MSRRKDGSHVPDAPLMANRGMCEAKNTGQLRCVARAFCIRSLKKLILTSRGTLTAAGREQSFVLDVSDSAGFSWVYESIRISECKPRS